MGCNYHGELQAFLGTFRASKGSSWEGIGEETSATVQSAIFAYWRCTLARISRAAFGLAECPSAFRRMRMTRYPRQYVLAVALREIGRVGRALFIVEWWLDADRFEAQDILRGGPLHRLQRDEVSALPIP